ncbi:uncharacterized protein BO95DRAFT_281664 [Aspergillus brunneoviolaceus CBS 621.78]|uniref:Uncharacterized protein n=1 Tax=Aspergillus brunneoviolaceus CBS 621.78 TaxID=1450534 RepID=A0ACD1FV35_9EURO|nr:hypothetical protein BO95DRAFT_281664 [Aspergillus brunneoviolaceus CBS 621.78]RAH40865.1 hypothetical protein BO95DRAFT_281664 [Aspergillus brunneoviolaceus CBS 621.78]
MIGKRKRGTAVVSRATTSDDEATPQTTTESSQDIFRKFFEAQFQPLDVPGGQVSRRDDSEDESDEEDLEASDAESDWDGMSGDEEEPEEVEVIEHRDVKSQDLMDKKARKAFMTAKPPSSISERTTAKTPKKDTEDDNDDTEIDADHLKNDLALQRLLKESHLLDSASDLAPTGKNRIKALDLRMQELGSKESLYKQMMPSSHRRGIKAKAEMKENKRRKEARENGIILEKPAPKSNTSSAKRRERGVGGPSVGKFAGGTLNLSKHDVAAIQASGRSSSRGRGRGGGRGRR